MDEEMPKDNRTYITVTVDMPRNPKYAELTKAQKFVLIEAWCHCREYKTDGFVSKAVWTGLATKRDRIAIESLNGVEQSVSPAGIRFTDFLEHQQSKAEIEEAQEKARSAGRKGGLKKAQNARAAVAEPLAGASETLEHMPSDRLAEEEEEEEESSYELSTRARTRSSGEVDDLFNSFWMCYPRSSGKIAARKSFAKAIKDTDPQIVISAAKAYADDPNRVDQYTAMPATWLNQGRYLDESPLPQRISSNKSQTQRGMEYLSHTSRQNPHTPSPLSPAGYADPFGDDDGPLAIGAGR